MTGCTKSWPILRFLHVPRGAVLWFHPDLVRGHSPDVFQHAGPGAEGSGAI